MISSCEESEGTSRFFRVAVGLSGRLGGISLAGSSYGATESLRSYVDQGFEVERLV